MFFYKFIKKIKRKLNINNDLTKIIDKEEYRNKKIREDIELFNMNFNKKISKKRDNEVRILILWEANERMKWFDIGNKDNDINILFLPRGIIGNIWKNILKEYFIKKDEKRGDFPLDIYFNPIFKQSREIFQNISKSIITFIFDYFKIDLIILPKLNDDWIVDFIIGINKANKPVLVDDRESAVSPARMKEFPPKMKKYLDFDIDKLNLHNFIHKEQFIKSGIDESKMTVHGCPQSDYWLNKGMWKDRRQIFSKLDNNKFMILFFSFGAYTYLNYYFPNEKRNWISLINDYHDVIFELLRNFGDKIQIVYKTGAKKERDLNPNYNLFFNKTQKYINEENFIVLDTKYSSFDLTTSCDLILGFQTSGMIEAMFTDKPIVYGGWGVLFDDVKDDLLPLHKTNAIIYVKSKEQMKNKIKDIIENKDIFKLTDEIKEERKGFRETYFNNPDGKVCERILQDAKKIVLNKKKITISNLNIIN